MTPPTASPSHTYLIGDESSPVSNVRYIGGTRRILSVGGVVVEKINEKLDAAGLLPKTRAEHFAEKLTAKAEPVPAKVYRASLTRRQLRDLRAISGRSKPKRIVAWLRDRNEGKPRYEEPKGTPPWYGSISFHCSAPVSYPDSKKPLNVRIARARLRTSA